MALPPESRCVFGGVFLDKTPCVDADGVQRFEKRSFRHVAFTALVQKAFKAFEKLGQTQFIARFPVAAIQVNGFHVFKKHFHAVALPEGVDIEGQHGIGKTVYVVFLVCTLHQQRAMNKKRDDGGKLRNTAFFHDKAGHFLFSCVSAFLSLGTFSPERRGRSLLTAPPPWPVKMCDHQSGQRPYRINERPAPLIGGMGRENPTGETPQGAEAQSHSGKLHKPEGGKEEDWRGPCA
jgi:hypothetical protein